MIDNLADLPRTERDGIFIDYTISDQKVVTLVRSSINETVMHGYNQLRDWEPEDRIESNCPLYRVVNAEQSTGSLDQMIRVGTESQRIALAVLESYGLNLDSPDNLSDYNEARGREKLTFRSQLVVGLSFTRLAFYENHPPTAKYAEWMANFWVPLSDTETKKSTDEKAYQTLHQIASIVPPELIQMANEADLALPEGLLKHRFGPDLSNDERIQFAKFLFDRYLWWEDSRGSSERKRIFIKEIGIPAAITGNIPQDRKKDELISRFGGLIEVAKMFNTHFIIFRERHGYSVSENIST